MKTKGQKGKHNFLRSVSGLFLALVLVAATVIPMPLQAAEKNGTEEVAASAVVPGKVKITSAKAPSATMVFLDWNPAKYATSYHVYYKLSSAKSWTKLASVRDTGYAHISSKKYPLKERCRYQYRVRAYCGKSKRWGSYSDIVTVVPKNVQPTSVKFNKTTMSLTLSKDKTPTARNLLGVTILPKNATTNLVKMTVSNPKVVSLQYTQPGIFVLARRKGTTTITATCPNGKKAVCRVTVK